MDKRYKVVNFAVTIILYAGLSFSQESFSILDVKLGDSLDTGKSKIASDFKKMVCNEKKIEVNKTIYNIGVECFSEENAYLINKNIASKVEFSTDKNKNIISITRKIHLEKNKFANFESTDSELVKKYGNPQFEYLSKNINTGEIVNKSYLWRADKKDVFASTDNEAKKIASKFRDYSHKYSLSSRPGYINNELYNTMKKPITDDIIGTFLFCIISTSSGNDKLVDIMQFTLTDQNLMTQSNNDYVNMIIDKMNSSSNKEVEQSKSIKTKF